MLDSYQEAARILRAATKNKGYRAYPLGQEGGHYLRSRRGQWTPLTYQTNESLLDKLARYFPDLELSDLEPPTGRNLIEQFLDHHWGEAAPRTYNKSLSMTKEFFKWARLRDKMVGDPTLGLSPHKKRPVHRETFSDDQISEIIASQDGGGDGPLFALRDRIALRLLLLYGIRKGALRKVQFKHFDHNRHWLTIFTKGEQIRDLPIPGKIRRSTGEFDENGQEIVELHTNQFWLDLERYILEWGAEPNDYLMCREHTITRGDKRLNNRKTVRYQYRDTPMGVSGTHNWWYRCLERAGIVAKGTTSGERMHKARHTAGQRVLDKTKGNIKAVQKLLGHADPSTTMSTYVDWDIYQLEDTLQDIE